VAATTIPPEAAPLIDRLLADQKRTLGDRLLATYLFGSAASGSFEPGVSDLDTVAVLATDPTDGEILALALMHARLTADLPEWDDRIEVDYVSAEALANFRIRSWPSGRISPGEPFHRVDINGRWVLDWYHVLHSGIALYGPPPQVLIPPISHLEFVTGVRRLLREWPDRLTHDLGSGGRAFAVLTACRALGLCQTGDHMSKKDAAMWAATRLPQFQDLISRALARRYQRTTAEVTSYPLEDTRDFLRVVADLCG
jgi:predicted nucleotidyltransferase